jgi:hypothetical protein
VSARLLLTLALILPGTSSALAQSRIPSSEMPGRERERFVDSPFELYRKPQLQIKLQSADPLPRLDRVRKKPARPKRR